MERILGLLDTLESMICDSFKMPLTGKTMVNEAEVLAIIDKIRLVIQSGDRPIMKSNKREIETPAPRQPELVEVYSAP